MKNVGSSPRLAEPGNPAFTTRFESASRPDAPGHRRAWRRQRRCQRRAGAARAWPAASQGLDIALRLTGMEVGGESLEPPLADGRALADHQVLIAGQGMRRSEEHTSELQSLMRLSYAVLCLKKKPNK